MLKVTEDLVRYMKAASENNSTFLVDDPIWAEDFAPNGKYAHPVVTQALTNLAH